MRHSGSEVSLRVTASGQNSVFANEKADQEFGKEASPDQKLLLQGQDLEVGE